MFKSLEQHEQHGGGSDGGGKRNPKMGNEGGKPAKHENHSDNDSDDYVVMNPHNKNASTTKTTATTNTNIPPVVPIRNGPRMEKSEVDTDPPGSQSMLTTTLSSSSTAKVANIYLTGRKLMYGNIKKRNSHDGYPNQHYESVLDTMDPNPIVPAAVTTSPSPTPTPFLLDEISHNKEVALPRFLSSTQYKLLDDSDDDDISDESLRSLHGTANKQNFKEFQNYNDDETGTVLSVDPLGLTESILDQLGSIHIPSSSRHTTTSSSGHDKSIPMIEEQPASKFDNCCGSSIGSSILLSVKNDTSTSSHDHHVDDDQDEDLNDGAVVDRTGEEHHNDFVSSPTMKEKETNIQWFSPYSWIRDVSNEVNHEGTEQKQEKTLNQILFFTRLLRRQWFGLIVVGVVAAVAGIFVQVHIGHVDSKSLPSSSLSLSEEESFLVTTERMTNTTSADHLGNEIMLNNSSSSSFSLLSENDLLGECRMHDTSTLLSFFTSMILCFGRSGGPAAVPYTKDDVPEVDFVNNHEALNTPSLLSENVVGVENLERPFTSRSSVLSFTSTLLFGNGEHKGAMQERGVHDTGIYNVSDGSMKETAIIANDQDHHDSSNNDSTDGTWLDFFSTLWSFLCGLVALYFITSTIQSTRSTAMRVDENKEDDDDDDEDTKENMYFDAREQLSPIWSNPTTTIKTPSKTPTSTTTTVKKETPNSWNNFPADSVLSLSHFDTLLDFHRNHCGKNDTIAFSLQRTGHTPKKDCTMESMMSIRTSMYQDYDLTAYNMLSKDDLISLFNGFVVDEEHQKQVPDHDDDCNNKFADENKSNINLDGINGKLIAEDTGTTPPTLGRGGRRHSFHSHKAYLQYAVIGRYHQVLRTYSKKELVQLLEMKIAMMMTNQNIDPSSSSTTLLSSPLLKKAATRYILVSLVKKDVMKKEEIIKCLIEFGF